MEKTLMIVPKDTFSNDSGKNQKTT
jgi:hypothetical protein